MLFNQVVSSSAAFTAYRNLSFFYLLVVFCRSQLRKLFIVRLIIPTLCVGLLASCKFFDPNSNCFNPQSSCFVHQTVAPYVVSYIPIPNRGSTTVSKLTGIQITFSQRLKDWLNPDNYQLTNLGNLKIASIEQTGTYTVTLNLSGKLSNGNVDLSFPKLTNFTSLPFAKGASLRLIGDLDIGVNILDSETTYFVSSAGGTGNTSTTITWSHDYRIDPQNNNSYVLKIGGSTCADASAISGGTNISGSNLPAYTPVVSTIPASGNFNGSGTYFVRVCVQNNSGFNKSGESVAVVVNDSSAPVLQASIGGGAYGRQQTVSFSCTDNCRGIAYNVVSGSSALGSPAAPIYNTNGTLLSGTPITGSWTTPYNGDSTYSAITVVAIDAAGNQSAPLSLSYHINSSIPLISFSSPAPTKTYVSANSINNSSTVTWQANQSGNYVACLGGSGCAAGPGCGSGVSLGSAQPYIQGSLIDTQFATNGSPALSGGNNTIHICLSNGVQVADSSLTIYRSDTLPSVASIAPANLANAIPSAAPITITISDPIDLDLTSITTNTTDRSCSGTLQISLASDDFAPNTCMQMSSQPIVLSSQTFQLRATGGFEPGIYKVRVTTGVRDVAGNALAPIYTQVTGFAVSGLLRQFTFNNDSTDLQDRALTDFHLSASGQPKKVNGADGDSMGAYKFDGSGNTYLSGLDNGLPLGQGPRTICAWVNTASQCGTNCVAMMYGASGGAYLGNRTSTGGYGFAGGADFLGGTSLKLNTWTHLCHAYDGSNLRIYLNGIQDGSASVAATTTLGAGVVIGKASPSASQSAFNGRVDDVRIYAGALTPSVIRQMAVQVPTGLLLYYSFSDAAAQTVTDYSNNGHNGTLVGNPTPIADRFGTTGAYNFASTNQWIAASDIGQPAGTSARTTCVWVLPTALPSAGSYAAALRYGNPSAGEAQTLGLYNDGTSTKFFYGAWSDDLTGGLPATLNTWSHLCGTYDGEKASLYLNGSKVASLAKNWNTVLAGVGGILMGQGDTSGATAFSGGIDDVRIYGRVLEQHEITVLSSQLGSSLLRQYSFESGRLTEDNGGPSLTAIGNPALGNGADGAANNAFTLNGTSQYFFSNDTGLPMGNFARTMCVRVNPVNVGLNAFALSYGTTNVGENSFLFSGGLAGLTFGNFANNLTSSASLPANKWSQFCSVLDAEGKATIFLNGIIPAGGGPSAINFTTLSNGTFTIGARSDFALRWAGSLDDVRIYSRALNPAEILELQNY